MRQFLFSRYIILWVLLSYSSFSIAQSRIFFSVGTSLSTNYENNSFFYPGIGNAVWKTSGSYIAKGFGSHITFDLELEKGIGRLTGVTGVRFFNSGYSNTWSGSYSSLKSHHIGIPFQIRLNMDNWLYADLGIIVVSTISASLSETAYQGTPLTIQDEGNIWRYFNPFAFGFSEQLSLVYWRYTFSFYFTIFRQKVRSDFGQDWKINGSNSNRSLFTRDFAPNFRISLIGLKIGIRLR